MKIKKFQIYFEYKRHNLREFAIVAMRIFFKTTYEFGKINCQTFLQQTIWLLNNPSLSAGAGATFDWTIFDNSKLIDFDC